MFRDRARQIGVHDTRLHHRDTIIRPYLQHTIHARALDQHRARHGVRATRQPGPRTARHKGAIELPAGLHHGSDLRGVGRQHHGIGPSPRECQPIALIDEQLLVPRQAGRRTNDRTKPFNKRHERAEA